MPYWRIAAWLSLVVVSVGTFALVRAAGPVRVVGGSMRPALLPGDLCFIQRTGDLQVGDVVLVATGGDQMLHRLVRVDTNGQLHTKGDANPAEDLEPVSRQQVRGRVERVIPVGRLVDRWRRLRFIRYTLGSTE